MLSATCQVPCKNTTSDNHHIDLWSAVCLPCVLWSRGVDGVVWVAMTVKTVIIKMVHSKAVEMSIHDVCVCAHGIWNGAPHGKQFGVGPILIVGDCSSACCYYYYIVCVGKNISLYSVHKIIY